MNMTSSMLLSATLYLDDVWTDAMLESSDSSSSSFNSSSETSDGSFGLTLLAFWLD